MATGVLVPNNVEVATFAGRADRLDYDSLWTPELWGRDAFVSLTRAAAVTTDIALGTAIVNTYGRSPATLAQAAATLAESADGQIRLGVGTSTRKVVEDLHAGDFDNPPRRLHETVELIKKFLSDDDSVSYQGKEFDVSDFPGLDADVPVYAAALGPSNRRATGRTADGWLPHNVPFSRLGETFETVAETARERGRDPADIAVSPYVPSAVSDDPAEAISAVRGHIAYYVGSGEGYRKAVGASFPAAAETIAEAWRSGDREAARGAVTDDMMGDLAIAGTPADAREQLVGLAATDPVDEPIIAVPDGAPAEIAHRTVEVLAPANR